ncbi:TonB-dependent receptor plug domain-containing protein [Erythrobacter crassostreae]|uniref:TonB-dependent receptor plug domain-containing protein n=1 Tax=Erythrobacter crassostreae TaxID=2828328 RepID=A0A9X1JMF4_9SPHN|nr:TonB-dependent receptor plug domain-containing protein [Erythrobacter crassostrea]MBV7258668.1 TonB-dependent receptor plug domain-containing protein [Erythrobacter crassostrea]
MIHTRIALAALVAGCSLTAISTAANAQDTANQSANDAVQAHNIPAQPLESALNTFAETTSSDLLYPSELVNGKQSAALNGTFTVSDALQRLLRSTGLVATEVSANVYSLKDPNDASSQNEGNASQVAGVVRNAISGTVLPGAEVEILGTDLRATTDDRGFFYIPAVPITATELRVTYLGQPAEVFPIPANGYQRARLNVSIGETSNNITVFGYASSLQKSLNQQLRAANNSTVISSDLLGSFPAENVPEALRRVSGVAFGRDDATGEGNRITVRGFSSEAINVQLNGLELQGTGFERTIDLSGFLADNISEITIQKSLLPSMESTGSGGLVEIETKSGLDYDGITAQIGVEGETSLDPDFGEEYQINGLFSARLTDSFGVVANVQYRKTDRRNFDADVAGVIPQVLPAGFTSLFRVPASQQFPFDEEFNSRLESGVSYLRRDREEENLTASLNVAWDVSNTTNLRLDLQRIQRNSYAETARSTASFLTAGIDLPIPELGGEVRRRTTLSALRPNLSFNVTDLEARQDTVSLRGSTNLDRWVFNYKAGYQFAKSQSNNANLSALGNRGNNLVDLIDPTTIQINPDDDAALTDRVVGGGVIFQPNGLPILSLSQAGSDFLNDPANYNVTSASRTLTNSPTEAYTLEGSARYLPSLSWLEYVEAGIKWDRSERDANDDVFATTSTGALLSVESYTRIFGRDTGLDAFGTGLVDNQALSDIGAQTFQSPFLTGAAVDAIFNGLPNFLADDPNTPENEERFRFVDRRNLDPILDSGGLVPTETIEDRTAAYFEALINVGKFEFVGGGRYERVFRSGQAINVPSVRPATGPSEPRETFVNAGLVEFTNLAGAQEVFTPSVIINYRPQDNLVARFAYFRSTVNPDLRLIRRPRQVSLDLRPTVNRAIIREANPDLSPTITDNFDFDVAYYFTDTPGLIRAGFFYKNVKNNFTNVFFQDGSDTTVRDEILDSFGDLATTRPDLVAFNDETEFLRNRPENGGGGKIYGIELEAIRQLTFLPGRLSNFTVLGNLTWTQGDFPTLVSGRDDNGDLAQFELNRFLEDQPEWIYNASLSYAEGGFEGRVIYTHQSATASSFQVNGIDTVLPSYDTFDVRLSYSFDVGGTNFSVYLQGDDLLRGSQDIDLRRAFSSEFGGGSSPFFFPDGYQFNGGRTVTGGIRARF